nr:RNA-directed DNA polymerase, eukaryota, reverse transcriptase zinc-binding domain protein [Tanacetum cinerariifolium]
MSNYTQDMIEFQDSVNEIEIEDINCSRMHFTWTKSLLNPNATVLTNIDRIMGNSTFFAKFGTANVLFLPYGISDHSPAILNIPQAMIRKRKSFRLANYVADEREFTELVNDKWNTEVQGHAMYRLIQVAQKKVKIAFENADSSSRVKLIPSKIKYANKLQELAAQLTDLWNFMDTPEEDRRLFDHVTCNISVSVDKVIDTGALAVDLIE